MLSAHEVNPAEVRYAWSNRETHGRSRYRVASLQSYTLASTGAVKQMSTFTGGTPGLLVNSQGMLQMVYSPLPTHALCIFRAISYRTLPAHLLHKSLL
jgi:hypothetical protein